jgi:pimeloyl-ACP methyl ester carboxylesterase
LEIIEQMEEKYIECYGGVKLHTMMIGEGEPLILLHGFPDFWYGWKNVILGLYNDFKLIVPDTRGINLSTKPEGVDNYLVEYLVEDIKILSEKLNLSLFTLVGHDWGGAIAWAFSYKYPELLKKLVIIDAPHPKIFRDRIKKNPKQRRSSGYMYELLKPGGEQSLIKNDMMGLKAAVFGTARKKGVFTEEDKKLYIKAWSQPNALLCAVNYYRANRRMTESAGYIEVPTLVIQGMKDNFVRPLTLEGLGELVKDLEIVKVERSSHWVMHDAPEIVCSSIKEFVTS